MRQKMLLILLLAGFAVSIHAFGPVGHFIVADIAYNNLSCSAKKKVNKLLGTRGIVYESSWADNIKSDNRYEYSYNWHFQNLNMEMSETQLEYLLANPDSEGKFMFFALDSLTKALKNNKSDSEALKFIVHLVGDMYQPLHLGRVSDRGGNDIHINWFKNVIRLHQLWDTQIVESQNYSYTEYSQYLRDKYRKEKKQIKRESLQEAVWNTFQLSNRIYDYDYSNLNGYNYLYEFRNSLDEQLYRAGIRLSIILNDIF